MNSAIILIDEPRPCLSPFQFPLEKECPLEAIKEFMVKRQIKAIDLNPSQIYRYYTIPFALYQDIKSREKRIDYLLIDHYHTIQHFKKVYKEYWEAISAHFSYIHFIEGQDCHLITDNDHQ